MAQYLLCILGIQIVALLIPSSLGITSEAVREHILETTDSEEVSMLDERQLAYSSVCVETHKRIVDDLKSLDDGLALQVTELFKLLDKPLGEARATIQTMKSACSRVKEYHLMYEKLFQLAKEFLASSLDDKDHDKAYLVSLNAGNLRCLSADLVSRVVAVCNSVIGDREHLERLFGI